MYSYNPYYYEYLAHHGVKGQKWGIRRYQPYTSGQKGIFKNLRRSYKSSVRSLKKARRKYEQEGNQKAVDAATKAIKDTKSSYKSEKKGLKKEFRAENWERYKNDVVTLGTEKEIKKIYKDLNTEQLEQATRRLNRLQEYKKMSMRDVEAEVNQERAMAKMDKIIKGADTVSRVALATNSVTSAYKSFKDLFKKTTPHEIEMNKLAEEEKKADIEVKKQTAMKTEADRMTTLKNAGILKYQKVSDTEQKYYDDWKNKQQSQSKQEQPKSQSQSKQEQSKSQTTTSSNSGSKPSQYYTSSDPSYSKLSKAAQNGVKAYERAMSSGKGEKAAENARRQAIIKSQTDAVRVPVSEARKGTENAYRYILNNSNNYETKTVQEAENWFKKQYGG